MTRARSTTSLLLILLAVGAADAAAQEESAAFAPIGRLLQSRCAMSGCHAGPNASMGMRMEATEIYRATVNVHARSDGRYMRVTPGDPDQSLLYLKLLIPQKGHYVGPRMPLGMDALKPEEIEMVRQWIASFPADLWGHPPPAPEARAYMQRSFQDTTLANLPTPDTTGRKTLEFIFRHRFKEAVADAGSEGLWGLDSGAWISLELAYGVTDNIDLGMRRSNLETDYEWYGKWEMLRQAAGQSPLSLAFRGSLSDVRDTGRFNRTRWAGQVIAARRLFNEKFSVMLVPTYVTSTDSVDAQAKGGTAAVGGGAEYHVSPRFAVTGEYVAQTGGLKAQYQSASLGISMSTAHHVFHLMITNTPGTLTDQFTPGGDLDLRGGRYRLGFNISRTHTFE